MDSDMAARAFENDRCELTTEKRVVGQGGQQSGAR